MSNSIFEKWIFEHAQYFAVIEQLNTDIVRVLEGATPIFFHCSATPVPEKLPC